MESLELKAGPSTAGYNLARRHPRRMATEQCKTNKCLDGCCVTDPDTRVGLLQAQTCNMRSKCRCSCVLQFTLCHAFSSVLHRPPSQLIHCIALCSGFSRLAARNGCKEKDFKLFDPQSREGEKGGTKPGLLARTLSAVYGTSGLAGSPPPQSHDQTSHGRAESLHDPGQTSPGS